MSAWKNKKSQPTYKTLQKIADYFGVSVNELLSDNAADTKKEVVPVGTTSRDEQSDYIMHALSSMPKDMLDNIEEILKMLLVNSVLGSSDVEKIQENILCQFRDALSGLGIYNVRMNYIENKY